MADRTVKVSLLLNATGFMQGADAAAKKTRELGSEADKLAQKREAFNLLGTAALGVGAAIGVGIGMAISKFAEFDQQMSYVQAATHETAANMDLLRDAALEAGARTVFSATEAAGAVEELAKAGVSTADILSGGLDAALDLAAAGGMGVADAAAVAATTLKQFGLEGKDASHVADLLAAGAGKAQGDVADMSAALKQGGLVANQFGISVDETVGTLSAFASAGMLGSDAGTSFRTMLLRLANPSGEAAEKMKELGISAYDAQGQFIGMEGLAGQLEVGLQGLTQEQKNAALAIIFGQDAIRGANVLLKEGAAGIAEWTDQVNDQGFAAETAAIRLDNLKGDLEALGGAFDTAFISMGEGANGPLREFTQQLTGMVDAFNGLPDWAQQSALGVGALAAAVALGSGAFLLGVPKVAAYNAAIATMGAGAQRASRLVGALGKAAGVGALFYGLAASASKAAEAMGLMGESAKSAEQTTKLLLDLDFDGMFKGLSAGSGGVNDLESALDHLLSSDASAAFNRWGSDAFAFTQLPSAVGDARDQFNVLGDSLAELVRGGKGDLAKKQFDELAASAAKYGYTSEQVAGLLPSYTDALTGVENASRLAGSATGVASDGMSEMEAASVDAERALSDVVQALQDVASGALNLGDAKDRALSAINGMAEAADNEKASLSGTNDESIRLRDSVREVEQAHRDSAQAILENGGTLQEAQVAWQTGRDAVLKMLEAKGMDREEAIRWADQNMGSAGQVSDALYGVKSAMDAIPEKKPIKVTIDTSEAQRGLNQWIQAGSNRVIRVKVAADGGSFSAGSYTVSPIGHASGGPIFGAGTGTSDSILRRVSNGEHVITAAEVQAAGGHAAVEKQRAQWLQGTSGVWQQGSMAAPAPSVNVAAPSMDGMQLSGTLDMGNGLVGFVKGIVSEQRASAQQVQSRLPFL